MNLQVTACSITTIAETACTVNAHEDRLKLATGPRRTRVTRVIVIGTRAIWSNISSIRANDGFAYDLKA